MSARFDINFTTEFRGEQVEVAATVQPADRSVGIMGSWLDEFTITLPDGSKFAGEATDAEVEALQEQACALYDEDDGAEYDPDEDDDR